MEANTFSYSIYKNEYESTMIEFFKQTFEVEYETEQIVTFTNLSQADCMNMAACMFKTVKNCKAIFPNVKTIDESFQDLRNELAEAHMRLKEILIKFHGTPAYLGGELMDDSQYKLYDAAHEANVILNKAYREYNK